MEKQNYSYIGYYCRKKVSEQVEACNRRLAMLKTVMDREGEGLKEANRYDKEGWDVEIIAKQTECRKWMDKHEMPQYLRNDYLQRAIDSIGTEKLTYYQNIGHLLPVACGAIPVDFSKDITENSGKWELSETYVNNILEKFRYTLSDDEMEDLRLCMEAADAIKKVKERKIKIDDLIWFDRNKDKAELAEGLIRSYVGESDPNAYLHSIGVF